MGKALLYIFLCLLHRVTIPSRSPSEREKLFSVRPEKLPPNIANNPLFCCFVVVVFLWSLKTVFKYSVLVPIKMQIKGL